MLWSWPLNADDNQTFSVKNVSLHFYSCWKMNLIEPKSHFYFSLHVLFVLQVTVNFLSLAALRLGLAELILAGIKVKKKKKNCPKSEN